MSTTLEIALVLKAMDKTSGGLKSAESKIQSLNQKTKKLGSNMLGMGKNMLKAGGLIAGGAAAAGAALSVPIKAALDFDDALTRIGAKSGFAGDQMSALSKKAQELGASVESRFGASEILGNMEVMLQAGRSFEDIMGSSKSAIDLAQIGGMELADATSILVDVMDGYGLKASEAGMATDVLSEAALSANLTLSQMGQSYQKVAKQASSLGFSIEDVGAAVGSLSSIAKGAEAGSALKRIFSKSAVVASAENLKSLTQEQRRGLSSLGITKNKDLKKFQESLKSADIETIFKDIESRSGGLSAVQKQAMFKNLFGEETAAQALTLSSEVASGGFARKKSKIGSSQGSAAERSAIAAKSAAAQVDAFKAKLEAFSIKIGMALIPSITRAMNALGPLIDRMSDWISANEDTIAKFISYIPKVYEFGVSMNFGLGMLVDMGKKAYDMIQGVSSILGADGLWGKAKALWEMINNLLFSDGFVGFIKAVSPLANIFLTITKAMAGFIAKLFKIEEWAVKIGILDKTSAQKDMESKGAALSEAATSASISERAAIAKEAAISKGGVSFAGSAMPISRADMDRQTNSIVSAIQGNRPNVNVMPGTGVRVEEGVGGVG